MGIHCRDQSTPVCCNISSKNTNARNWKSVCLSAVCSAGTTVTAKMQTIEQLTEASECVGKLKALRVETIIPTYDLDQVSEKYQQIISEFSTIDC